MAKVLLLVHTEADGSLVRSAREAATAAATIAADLAGSELVLGLVGADVSASARALGGCGAAQALAVSGDAFGVSRYVTDAAAAAALIKASGADLVIAPGTSRWSRALPGATARAGGKIDTHVSGIDTSGGELKIHRWFYRQRMKATLSRKAKPWVLLVDGGVFAPWTGGEADVAVTAVDPGLTGDMRTEVVGIEAPPADAQTIRPDADLLFVAGAGWTKKQADGQPHVGEAAELIQGFIKGAKASLGSSKSLVDLQSEGQQTLSFMSHLNQVGQTGSTPRHPKGLATCCHGEEPHVVGWRFIGDRRAINLDANCGWAQGKADVLYVADAFEVMKRVNAMLG